ncbi:MAG: cytochrome C oxidase subunit IV family protein [Candidatus Heimdallarchaeota archaeon]
MSETKILATSGKHEPMDKQRPYLMVFGFLAVLTVVEVAVGLWSIDKPIQVPILGLLALAKAFLVAAYFIGIRYEAHPYLVIGVVFVLPLLVAIPVAVMPIYD